MVDINKKPAWFRSGSRCRYSHLPVSHPDIFVSRHPDSNYFVDIAKLGDRICLVKASGYVRSYEMAEALRFIDGYISTHFDKKAGIVYIEDYADVEGADSEARKAYIHYFENNEVFWGWIVYNLPLLYRISFKIAKRLHARGRHMYAVALFEQAIDLAEEIISQCNAGNILCQDNDSDPQCLPIKTSEASPAIFRQAAGKINNLKLKPFGRFKERITRKYSEELLKYIESIDWHRDGIEAPAINHHADPSVRKVFEAVSYLKSEMDDLLRERDTTEHVLRESETRYRQLVEHARAGILEFDFQTNRIISVNDSLLGISGYSKEEMLSMNPMDLMTEESKKIFARRFSQRLEGKNVSPESAYQFVSKNGQTKWVLLNTNITYQEDLLRKAEVILTDITHLKEIENKLVGYQSKLRQLSIQLSKTEEIQRRQLASQLHESVSQELFAAQLKLNAFEKSLDDPKHASQLDEIKDQIVKSIKEIRGITYDLSPPVLYDLGLREAVESLAKSIESKNRLVVKTRFYGSLEYLDEEIKLTVYRVIKEIIQNAIKHAWASNVAINIDNSNNQLSIDVSDNGIGFDAGSLSEGHYEDKGFGLFDIMEKINHLSGRLTIHSAPGSGTRINLVVPLNEPVFPILKN